VSFALRSAYDSRLRHAAERLLSTGYTMARRLSRRGTIEQVCQTAVEQVSRSLGADRVALALYRPEDDRLVVAATHGYSAAVVRDERIAPGAWVLGHVFAVRRPVVVRDVREIPGMSLESRPYRTYSFAAVPLLAGSETIGVLCATDKRDGSPFNRRDAVALRTFSVSTAVALSAAKTDAEVHRLAYAATVDALTGLFNRRYLDGRLHQEVERAKRASNSLTVLMADIDDFKLINDTHGHPVGDAILRDVGQILRSAVRVFDICARYGGDEFAIVMPSSDRQSAMACAERIRQRIAESTESVARVTMSIGVAVIDAGDGPDDLIRRADACLYRAKAEGKNRVAVDQGLANVGIDRALDEAPDEPV
jgi:diguanylate cyclase (GGDEF)-like protein